MDWLELDNKPIPLLPFRVLPFRVLLLSIPVLPFRVLLLTIPVLPFRVLLLTIPVFPFRVLLLIIPVLPFRVLLLFQCFHSGCCYYSSVAVQGVATILVLPIRVFRKLPFQCCRRLSCHLLCCRQLRAGGEQEHDTAEGEGRTAVPAGGE